MERSNTIHRIEDDAPPDRFRLQQNLAPVETASPQPLSDHAPEETYAQNVPKEGFVADGSSQDVWIAIMGVTGAGKSKFIKLLSQQDVQVGHGLESCTRDVDQYDFELQGGQKIHLIDTPGFDDTHRSDREVLNDIAGWLGTSYENDIRLAGIIYLHRIIDPRMAGSSLRNLIMFKKLCGEDCYPRVILATTFWDAVEEKTAIEREQELTGADKFWGTMIRRGSRTERCYGDRESALRILEGIVDNHGPSVVLDVQKEMVDLKLTLDETSAGREVSAKIVEERKKFAIEIAELKKSQEEFLAMKDREAAEELERERRQYEEKIQLGIEDQKMLRTTLEELQRRKMEDLKEFEIQMEEAQKTVRSTIEESRMMKERLERQDPKSPEAAQTRHRINDLDENIKLQNEHIARKKKEIKQKKGWFSRGWTWVKKNPGTVMGGAGLMLKVFK